MRVAIIMSIFLFLAACSSPHSPISYIPPTSGPVAKITFENKSHRIFRPSLYIESRMCKVKRSIKELKPGQSSTHIIPANRELTFLYYQTESTDGQYCLFNLRFTAVAGKVYKFIVVSKGDECMGGMSEMIKNKHHKNVKLKQIPFVIGSSVNGSFCNE